MGAWEPPVRIRCPLPGAEWEQGLSQLKLQSEESTSAASNLARLDAPNRAAAAADRQPKSAASSEQARDDGLAEEKETELPFEGRHLLEVCGLNSLVLDTQLEKQVCELATGIPPLVRYTASRLV